MKIEVVKQKVEDNEIYKIKKMEYCCARLKANPLIRLRYEYVENVYCNNCDVPADFDCRNCGLNITTNECGQKIAMMIEEKDTHAEPWENDYTTDYRYYPIEFCPHCGQAIRIEVVKEEDLTDKFKELKKQREVVHKQIRLTDSKKKEEKLNKESMLITKTINEMFENCSWYKNSEET